MEETVREGSSTDGLWYYEESGAGQEITVEADAAKNWTLSFWIRPLSSMPEETILCCTGDNTEMKILCRTEENGILKGLTLSVQEGNDAWTISAGDGLLTRQWSMIALQSGRKGTRLYMNGICVAETDRTTALQGTIRFGGEGSTAGKVSGIRINDWSEEVLASEYEAHRAAVLLDRIEYPDQDHLRRSLWFDGVEVEGVPVQWTVESNETMNYLGVLTSTDRDTDVIAHARMELPGSSAEKTFVFHVKGDTAETLFEEDCSALDTMIEGVLFSGTGLPQSIHERTEVIYTVSEGARIEDGRLVKESQEERLPITLHASLASGSLSCEREYSVVLLDEAYGYLMTYFNGEEGRETGYTAVSTDGLTWEKTDTVISGTDTHSVRDPHVSRRADGAFIVTATASWDSPWIWMWESEDMVRVEDGRLIRTAWPDPGIYMDGTRAWAPDLYYDNENGVYWIYFSAPAEERGPVYAVTTRDLEHFSYPEIFFDPQYPVIDASLFPMDGCYWIVYKDERGPAQTIYSAVTDRLGGNIWKTYDYKHLILERAVEGPIVFRDVHTDRYHLYADHFSDHTFLAGTFDGLDYDHTVDWSDTERLVLPEEDVRHGSVIPITEKEYRKLTETE